MRSLALIWTGAFFASSTPFAVEPGTAASVLRTRTVVLTTYFLGR
jgi:hypothetical protein